MSVVMRISGQEKANPANGLPRGHELFGRTRLTGIIQEYLGEPAAAFDQYTRSIDPLPTRAIHLNDAWELRTYVGNQKHLQATLRLVKTHLGSSPRPVRDINQQYTQGYSFCIYPEILARTMELARNKIALEIAGAQGENAACLALAGAKRVYMNERAVNEIVDFRTFLQTLPAEMKPSLKILEGDCFQILEQKPKLQGGVSVVLCRNLIQFFPDREMEKFFGNLQKLLEPGGRAILTTNSINASRPQVIQDNAQVTCFTRVKCVLVDNEKKSERQLFAAWFPLKKSPVSLDPQQKFLWTRQSGSDWKFHPEMFKTFSRSVQDALQVVITREDAAIKQIKEGCVGVEQVSARFFTQKTLAEIINTYGFTIESVFATSETGHLVPEEHSYTLGSHVGVIIQKPFVK